MTTRRATARSLFARTQQLELMDDRSIGGAELSEALSQLRLINTLLLAYGPTVRGVAELWRSAGRPQTLEFLDVGAGSGDAARALLRWAERHGIALHITLLDLHPDTCAVAAAVWRSEPRVRVVCGDVHHLPPHSVDIVTAALVVHHFSDEQLPALLDVMVRAARFGVVINDLHRHPLAYAAIWLATRCWSRNRMIRNDAPLSVRRGFVAADWERLGRQLPAVEFRYRRQAFFRWKVLLRKNSYLGNHDPR